MKEAKGRWMDEQCGEIEKVMTQGNSKRAHRTLKLLTKTQQNKTRTIEDRVSNLLTENSEGLNGWPEYSRELYNFSAQPDRSILKRSLRPPGEPSPLPIMKKEVEVVIQSLPADKSPRADNFPAERLKQGGNKLVTLMSAFCQEIWETKKGQKNGIIP